MRSDKTPIPPATTASRRPADTVDWDDPAGVALLRTHGMRPTAARRRILALLARVTDHPTVDDLRRRLAEQDRAVKLPTLYQNLNLLADAGLILRLVDDAGLMRFDPNVAPHHHVLCTGCGRMADAVVDERGEAQLRSIAVAADIEGGPSWAIESANLDLRGVCPACRPTS